MAETWRAVPGYEGFYDVSDQGRVRSLARSILDKIDRLRNIRERIVKPTARGGHRKYPLVNLWCNNQCVPRLVHQLVLEAFVGPCPLGWEACHLDDDPTNNTLQNLRWDTRTANATDRIRNGRQAHGSSHGMSKLDECDVMEIWQLRGLMSQKRIARIYEIDQGTISRIFNGKRWVHVIAMENK